YRQVHGDRVAYAESELLPLNLEPLQPSSQSTSCEQLPHRATVPFDRTGPINRISS
ncbi:5104_t:CDS:1, partial [Acaulospora colombiana]